MATLLSFALTTLADVKESLGIDAGNTSKDNLIIRKINQATKMIENYCNRRFKETTYTQEEYNGQLIDQFVLRQAPITAFSILQVRDTSLNTNDWTTIDTQQYFRDDNAGILNAIASFYGRWNRWRVTYTAGYATIPEDVAEACATLAAFIVENGVSGQTIRRKTEGSRMIEYHNPNQTEKSLIEQLGLDDLLDAYVRPTLTGMR